MRINVPTLCYSMMTLLLFFGLTLFAQKKGLSGLIVEQPNKISNTFAVIIGVSDYQNPEIPDLSFAHKDAEAFAEFLKSPAGGNLRDSNLKLLLNEVATGAAVATAIDWLYESVEKNDRAIIYFSGHGDVERKGINQLGFLLCWDSGPKIYMAGGTYSLYYLQNMISSMSMEKEAQVIMIADACRSGHLAGSAVNGPQMTAANLAQQYENEIKILSCQPDEFSVEGLQWGGGRGAFSYHLIEGLIGKADANQDDLVKLIEIGRYLEDNVSAEVAPLSQIPMVVGSRGTTVAQVDERMIADLLIKDKDTDLQINYIASKSNLSESIMLLDSNIYKIFVDFENALLRKEFLEPKASCAEFYYNQLIADNSINHLHPEVTRRYSIALQDDAQQSINAILEEDPNNLYNTNVEFQKKFREFPKLLNRASQLLGKQHYLYNNIKAREYLFDGILLYMKYSSFENPSDDQGQEILDYYFKALELEPEMALTHFFVSLCYSKILKDSKQGISYATKASDYAGSWARPYVNLAYYLSKDSRDFDAAKIYLDKATEMDSMNAIVWKGWTSWYLYQRDFAQALIVGQKVVKLTPQDPYAWLNIAGININIKNYPAAKTALNKTLELDSSQYNAYYYLGIVESRMDNYDAAENNYLAALSINPESERIRIALAKFYTRSERYAKAESQYVELTKYMDPKANIWFDMAKSSTMNQNLSLALEHLEKSLAKGFKNLKKIESDPMLLTLRSEPGYKNLIQKYFKE
jgi:tetratricopeptide (TPR) repeat protein